MAAKLDRGALDRVLAIGNGKGGVFKTSLVTNMAGLLGEAGHRVLIVDLDPQGNVGEDLGFSGPGLGDDGETLNEAVVSGAPLKPVLEGIRPNLDVIPGGSGVNRLAAQLEKEGAVGRDSRLALATSLSDLAGDYDLVLIDLPPNDRTLQPIALGAAKYLLIPSKTDASSRRGLAEIARLFGEARVSNPSLELLGVVLTGINPAARRVQSQARAALVEDLGGVAPVLNSTIRHVEAAAVDGRARGLLAHELERELAQQQPWWKRLQEQSSTGKHRQGALIPASASSLAGDYAALSAEVLEHIVAIETRGGAQ